MNSREKIMLLPLLLLCALCCRIFSASFSIESDRSEGLFTFVPERLRSFIAARLWEKADLYMHVGPSRIEEENFTAGSYAGNTDLLPLLQAVTQLVPHELPPWQLLATNLGRHLGRRSEAIRLLQQAIHLNRFHSEIHELFASIGAIYIFTGKPDEEEKTAALKYIEKAIATFPRSRRSFDDHSPGLDLRSYYVLQSRLNIELSRPIEALSAWEKSGLPLSQDQGRLASMLIAFKQRGIIPNPREFEKVNPRGAGPESPAQPQTKAAGIRPVYRRSRFSLLVSLLLFAALAMFRARLRQRGG